MTISKVPLSTIKNQPNGISGLDANGRVQNHSAFSVSIEKFGGIGDGITDNLAAFNAAMASFGDASKGGEIVFPDGVFYFSDTLIVDKRMTIRGRNQGEQPVTAATRLLFAANKAGIRVHSSLESPSGTSGSQTNIRDMCLHSLGGDAANCHGIWASAVVHLQGVNVIGFPQDGIHIAATSLSGTGLANLWSIRDCRSVDNGRDGLHVIGDDANAGLAQVMDCSDNGRWGYYDGSALGNTYVACHAASNVRGSYKSVGNSAQCTYIGCYLEGYGNYGTELVFPTIIIGGFLSNRKNYPWVVFEGDGTGAIAEAYCPNGVCTRIIMTAQGSGYTQATASLYGGSGTGGSLTPVIVDGKIVSVTVNDGGSGHIGNGRAVAELKHDGSSGGLQTGRINSFTSDLGNCARTSNVILHDNKDDGITLRVLGSAGTLQFPMWNEGVKCWETASNQSATRAGLRIVSDLSTTETGNRSAPLTPGSIEFPLGYWIGAGTTARQQTNGTAAPTAGEWARGDIVWNRNPSAGGFMGWTCITAGTPGTWKTFGAISA